jgi:hypothetical protein
MTPDAKAGPSNPNKPIRAKLGEANSFYYDAELKRWINKNAGPEDTAKKATPPPPRAGPSAPRSVSASPASPPFSRASASAPPPMGGPPRAASSRPPTSSGADSALPSSPGMGMGGAGGALGPPPGPVAMLRSVSNTSTASAPPLGQGGAGGAGGPPSRPPTSLSNSSSIDDLLGAAGPRKPGAAKKARKGARYVDVMGK